MSHRLQHFVFTLYLELTPEPNDEHPAGPGQDPLKFGGSGQPRSFNLRIRTTQGMPKRKNFNRRALSCTATRTHLEGRRSVEVRSFPFKPCPRKPRAGVSGALWMLPIGTDVVLHICFCFQICNCLHELMKNGDAGYFLFTTALTNNTPRYRVCNQEHKITTVP